MKRSIFLLVLFLLLSFPNFWLPLNANQSGLQNAAASPWGFYGHRRINRMAVFTLPESDLLIFYKRHIAWLEEHAVDPDKRRYAFEEEAPRHFIDLDRYGPWPHDTLPRAWDEAVALFGEETVINNGIAPWHIERTMGMLRKAFRDRNIRMILRHSTDLGHYLSDLHVPLHCTENYNGGMTGQHGIHGFWESRLPELFAGQYDHLTGQARYLPNISKVIWKTALASSAAVDSVLSFERALSELARSDAKYAYEERGETVLRVYSREYSARYHAALEGMVERRMNSAILQVGSFWFTAWVDAGRPPLPSGDLEPPNPLETLMEKAVDQAFFKGRINGREHDDFGSLESSDPGKDAESAPEANPDAESAPNVVPAVQPLYDPEMVPAPLDTNAIKR